MIPMRSQTVLFGPAGLGKTTYAVMLAALVTRGEMPGIDGPRSVLISSQEDDLEGVLAPRAAGAEADRERIHFVHDLSLPRDMDRLTEAARAVKAALLIIDPIAAHLDASVDSHKDASTRKALAPIARLASDLDLAVLTIAHPNKATGGSGLSRLSGSGAFGNAARSVIVFGTDPADPEGNAGSKRVIGHLKCNVGKLARSISAEIETVEIQTEDGPAVQTRLRPTGTSSVPADELLDVASPDQCSKLSEARELLSTILAESPRPVNSLKAEAQKAGIGWRTFETAKTELGIKSVRVSGQWMWSANGGTAK
jgi:hypothetical protein